MRMKRYLAPDMRSALRQVRLEQGPDAVILSTRQLGDGVEICAAVDPAAPQDAASLLMNHARPAPAAPATRVVATATEPATPTAPPAAALSGADAVAVQEELRGLRRLLEQQFAALAWNDYTRREPHRAQALAELAEIGIGRDVAQEIVAALPGAAEAGQSQRPHLALLARRLPIAASAPTAAGGHFALVGPHGAGKSSTLAKLAARWVLEHGAASLALMSVDGERIGGGEQLRVLGRLLGAPVDVVPGARELAARLAARRAARLVLVDTAGFAPRAGAAPAELDALHAALPELRFLAVLPASAQAVVLDESLRCLASLAPCAAVLTRLDEAATLGGALSALVRARLPLAHVADGPRIPEDLHLARSHQLVARAVELARESGARADEDLLAHRFGGNQHAAA